MRKNFNWIIFVLLTFVLMTATNSDAKHQDKDEEGATSATASANLEATTQAAQSQCPKCQGLMEVGFVLENQGWDYPYTYTSYVTGRIKQSYRTTEVKTMLPIRSFRCMNCGYLEMYAK